MWKQLHKLLSLLIFKASLSARCGPDCGSVKDQGVNPSGFSSRLLQLLNSTGVAKAARQYVDKWAWLGSNRPLLIRTGRGRVSPLD